MNVLKDFMGIENPIERMDCLALLRSRRLVPCHYNSCLFKMLEDNYKYLSIELLDAVIPFAPYSMKTPQIQKLASLQDASAQIV